MKNKTAMMELIDKLRSNMGELGFIDWIKDNREQLLEKEKEQIIRAFNSDGMAPRLFDADAYYNQTYLREQTNDK